MSSTEDETDPNSKRFDALKALYGKKVKAPVPGAKVFENINQFEQVYKSVGSFDVDLTTVANERKKKEKPPKRDENAVYSARGRRFEAHQAPVKGYKKAKLKRNLLRTLEIGFDEGPIQLLKKFMNEGVRVKIYTRKEHGVRGFLTGRIEAFDTHMNIALADVFEQWTRRKIGFSESKLPALGPPNDCSKRLRELGISLPVIEVKSINRKYVECSRHIPQLLIRGEQIVLVTQEESTTMTVEEKAGADTKS